MGILIFLLNRISELTGLYFFSALLQADAAILGILGVFIIFKFQTIQHNIENLKNILVMRTTPEGTGGSNAYYLRSIISFEKSSLEKKEREIKGGYFGDDGYLFEQWLVLEKEKGRIKSLIKLPIILLGIGLVLNMIFLSIAEVLYHSGFQLNVIMGITIAYHAFLFINLARLIFKAVPPVKEK